MVARWPGRWRVTATISSTRSSNTHSFVLCSKIRGCHQRGLSVPQLLFALVSRLPQHQLRVRPCATQCGNTVKWVSSHGIVHWCIIYSCGPTQCQMMHNTSDTMCRVTV